MLRIITGTTLCFISFFLIIICIGFCICPRVRSRENRSIQCFAGKGEYVELCDPVTDTHIVRPCPDGTYNVRPCPDGTYNNRDCHADSKCKSCLDECKLGPEGTYEVFFCKKEIGKPECQCKDGYSLSSDRSTCHFDRPLSIPTQAHAVITSSTTNVKGTSVAISILALTLVLIVVFASVIYVKRDSVKSLCMNLRGGVHCNDVTDSADIKNESGACVVALEELQPALSLALGEAECPGSHDIDVIQEGISCFTALSQTVQEKCVYRMEESLCRCLPSAHHYSFTRCLIFSTLQCRPIPAESPVLLLTEADNIAASARVSVYGEGDTGEILRQILRVCRDKSSSYLVYMQNVLHSLQATDSFACLHAICKDIEAHHNRIRLRQSDV